MAPWTHQACVTRYMFVVPQGQNADLMYVLLLPNVAAHADRCSWRPVVLWTQYCILQFWSIGLSWRLTMM